MDWRYYIGKALYQLGATKLGTLIYIESRHWKDYVDEQYGPARCQDCGVELDDPDDDLCQPCFNSYEGLTIDEIIDGGTD